MLSGGESIATKDDNSTLFRKEIIFAPNDFCYVRIRCSIALARTEREPRMATYTLPELPYDFSALEPHISGAIVELHHDKHHAAYVKGAIAALEGLEAARNDDSLANVNKVQKDLAFNLGGRLNHSIFWNSLSANGGARPSDTRLP